MQTTTYDCEIENAQMSFLKTSLEKRIQELHKSIEAQKIELAAYQQVLALESGKPVHSIPPEPAPIAAVVNLHTRTTALRKAAPRKVAAFKVSPAPTPVAGTPVTVEFRGSRSDFVADAIKQRGSSGITPQEISSAFSARKIAVSKNLVYNVLSLMFKQKRVRKLDGRYYSVALKATAPTVKTPPAASAAGPKKSRISEEGMRRIIAATKKRWALQKAQAKRK